ncbi:hypothetical protein [Aurantibacter sp.]|uniref:hypothetical protein n=1 Tax=Aurantibacter sp. TaxID=2807103 RepID=UPI0035C84928
MGLALFTHLELPQTFIGLILLILGLFLATAKDGIILDKRNNKFKKTIFFLGLRLGKWKSFERFTDIAILTGNIGLGFYRFIASQKTTTFHSNKVFEVYMLTKNHRERIILKRYKQEEKATISAQDLAYELGMELNIFSPS